VAYLAAYDVGRARVFGRCAPLTGIAPFMALVEQVMTQQPYASAKRVFWVVDNGSSHRGKAAIDRLAARFGNAVMVHASWVNQVVRGLLLGGATQSRVSQRLHEPGRRQATTCRFREALQRDCQALPVEVHSSGSV
jgi:ferredoxin-NADP reductase